jgi:hypothetical protein
MTNSNAGTTLLAQCRRAAKPHAPPPKAALLDHRRRMQTPVVLLEELVGVIAPDLLRHQRLPQPRHLGVQVVDLSQRKASNIRGIRDERS